MPRVAFSIIGMKDSLHEIVGVPDHRMGETRDVILRAARQMIKPEPVFDPPDLEIYTAEGKKLVVATVRSSQCSAFQPAGLFWVRLQFGSGTFSVMSGNSRINKPS